MNNLTSIVVTATVCDMTRAIVNDRVQQSVHTSAQDLLHDNAYTMASLTTSNIDHERASALVSEIATYLAHTLVPDATRAACAHRDLAELAALTVVRSVAETLATRAATAAAEHGVRYPAIAAAVGTTRQNARVRWPGLTGIARRSQSGPADSASVDHRAELRTREAS